jgi:rhodanese-related sulfurtransferase
MTRLPARLQTAVLRDRLSDPGAPRVLDVRTPGEFATAHIPGSYNVPLDTLREHRDELRRRLDDDVVLVCRTGARAAQAEQALSETGMSNVHILDGGIVAWQAEGGPVNRGRSRWDLERQVRLIAGSLVLVGVLGDLVVPGLRWLSAAIGAGLTFAALSNICMMGMLVAKLPYNRGPACDIDAVVDRLVRDGRSR